MTDATQPQNVAASAIEDSKEMSAITMTSRIPDFWTDQPRIWFVQFEAIIKPQKLSDDAKYQLVITKLEKSAVQQITDILLSPPATEKYDTIKSRLLAIYEESETRQVQKLIGEMDLGEQRPSQLLRRMRDLARGKVMDDTLMVLWQNHLPAAVRAVLTVANTKDLVTLASIADKVMETQVPPRIDAVQESQREPTAEKLFLKEIAKISERISRLESNNKSYRNRSQSRNRRRSATPRRTPESPDWLCVYHFRYKQKARKCREPCSWRGPKPSEN